MKLSVNTKNIESAYATVEFYVLTYSLFFSFLSLSLPLFSFSLLLPPFLLCFISPSLPLRLSVSSARGMACDAIVPPEYTLPRAHRSALAFLVLYGGDSAIVGQDGGG